MLSESEVSVRECNICVVGSGMGGGTLSCALAASGLQVTLLEAGGASGRGLDVDLESVGRDFGMRTTRFFGLGGTTNLWHGLMSPLDKRDFRVSDPMGWPIELDDMRSFYEQAAHFLSDGCISLQESHFSEAPVTFPNIYKSWFEKRYFQARPVARLRKKLLHLVKQGRIKLHSNTRVVSIGDAPDGGKTVNAISGGTAWSRTFSHIVVCAGALESPLILKRSGFTLPALGKYLSDHPMGPLATIRLSSASYFPAHVGAITEGSYEYNAIRPILSPQFLNINLMVRPSFIMGDNFAGEKVKQDLICIRDGKASLKTFISLATQPLTALDVLQYKFALPVKSSVYDLHAVVEQTPLYKSSVGLSDKTDAFGFEKARVDWRIADSDIEQVRSVFQALKSSFGQESFGQFDREFDWHERFTSAAHHTGTCRMGVNRQSSVVDSHLEVHSESNIFVCDGSVIPANGSANPGITIAALAFRLAQHLREKVLSTSKPVIL